MLYSQADSVYSDRKMADLKKYPIETSFWGY